MVASLQLLQGISRWCIVFGGMVFHDFIYSFTSSAVYISAKRQLHVYIHTYIYTHVYVCIYIYMYVCMYADMYVYIYIYWHLYVCLHMQISIHLSMSAVCLPTDRLTTYLPVCVCVHVYIYIYIICVYTYMYMYASFIMFAQITL